MAVAGGVGGRVYSCAGRFRFFELHLSWRSGTRPSGFCRDARPAWVNWARRRCTVREVFVW